MTCERAAELIPWFLNETLDEAERREVLEHVGACAACRRALDEARFAASAADAHLSSAALVALAFGEPAPGLDPALVEEHLAACPRCAADLELARTSRALADEEVALFSRRVAAAPEVRRTGGWRAAAIAAGLAAVVCASGWLLTQQQVGRLEAPVVATGPAPGAGGEPGAGGDPAPGDGSRLGQLAEENRLLQAEAAERQAAEQAARQETEALRQQLARAGDAPGARANTVIADLRPAGGDVLRGAGDAGTRIALPAGSGALTLVLNSRERSSFRDHVAELRDASGRVVLTVPGLVQDEELNYYLTLDRDDLWPGGYTLELHGVSGGGREKLETYGFRIE